MADDAGEVIGKLARGSLVSRLFTSKKEPLRLTAVPRDHVAGDRARGDALLAGNNRETSDPRASLPITSPASSAINGLEARRCWRHRRWARP